MLWETADKSVHLLPPLSARMITANLVMLKRNDLTALRTGHAANNFRNWSQYFTV
jgi:hypothetical protein